MKTYMTILFAISLASCNSKDTKEKAMIEVITIPAIMDQNKIYAQNFIDTLTRILTDLQTNNELEINTTNLRVMLDSSTFYLEKIVPLIEPIEEADKKIDYKNKVIAYEELFISANKIEFKKLIDFLETKTDNKHTKASEIIMNKLISIKKAENIHKDARLELIEKYNIQFKE